ncbi:MAG: electron transfer flavoprotein subunit alpha/FixB family protein [Pseudomonadota bacterium]
MDYSDVWILAEQKQGRVQRISHELLARGIDLAKKSGCELCAMVFGNNIHDGDLDELIQRGANKVVAMQAPQLTHFLIEPYARCMLHVIDEYRPEIILAGATSFGRTLMPYVSMACHAGLTADCTGLDIEEGTGLLVQTRPAIGGNVMAMIKTPKHRPQMATVRPRSMKPAPRQQGRAGKIIKMDAPSQLLASKITRDAFVPNKKAQVLKEADIVVVVGRGIKKPENIPLVKKFADALGAALGASRDVVDRGWLSYSHQVGLSGKTINPKMYIGVGVSGAIQHLAGMQTSETIVAINIDPDAPIFKVANFGIVGDLFEVLPLLTESFKKVSDT